jgi:hypothetical protein
MSRLPYPGVLWPQPEKICEVHFVLGRLIGLRVDLGKQVILRVHIATLLLDWFDIERRIYAKEFL